MTVSEFDLRVVAADTLPLTVVWRAFLDGFRDYVVPVHIDEGPFAAMIASEHVDLSASRVAIDPAGVPVGICLLAIWERDAWCAGLGVAPSGRRRGLGRRLMVHTIEVARARGLERIRLECIDGNDAARNLYLGLGFLVERCLDYFDGEPLRREIASGGPGSVVDLPAPGAVWEHFLEYHPIRRAWQQDLPSLLLTTPVDAVSGIGIEDPVRPDAYVVFRAPAQANGHVDIVDAGVSRRCSYPVAAIGTLLAALAARYPGNSFRAPNVPNDDPLNPALRALGVKTRLSQAEMVLDLAGPA